MNRDPLRLLGELVRRRRDFLEQGEVLATLGLAWVLRDPAASAAVGGLLGIDGDAWAAEVRAEDSGRADLVCSLRFGEQDVPVCVVEAKIHHDLSAAQLRDYAKWLTVKRVAAGATGDGLLVVLVPESRRREAERLSVPGAPHAVVSWEELFEVIAGGKLHDGTASDLDQLRDLYAQYDTSWVAPFSPDETAGNWQRRREDYVRIADQLTVALHHAVIAETGLVAPRVFPLQPEGFRYVQMQPGPDTTSLAIGLFSALDGVPFALRYHRSAPSPTQRFPEIAARLEASDLPTERDRHGHLYVRLQIPVRMSQREILRRVGQQVMGVVRVAHPALADLVLD